MTKTEIFEEIEEIKSVDLNTFRENLWNHKYKEETLYLISNDIESCYTNQPLIKIDTDAYLSMKKANKELEILNTAKISAINSKKSAVAAMISAIAAFITAFINLYCCFYK